jgi:hypothetical protein
VILPLRAIKRHSRITDKSLDPDRARIVVTDGIGLNGPV